MYNVKYFDHIMSNSMDMFMAVATGRFASYPQKSTTRASSEPTTWYSCPSDPSTAS